MKFPFPALLLLIPFSALLAQTLSSRDASGSGSDATADAPGEKKAAAAPTPQGPTIINSHDMDYDEKTRVAIFTGEDYGVLVNDPSFVVYCDKLTAYMRKAGAAPVPGSPPAGPAAATPPPPPAPPGTPAPGAAASRTNGLQRAIAEGNTARPVVIVQDKPATTGTAPAAAVHNVGIAQKADYNADTGDVVLTGWPRVSQGVDTQIATAPYTVMTMNRDGHTMKTRGPSRTVIQQEQSKNSGAGSKSADQSPSPSQQ